MIILIDGPSGSGKTTLAHKMRNEYLSASTTCAVISMDSIYEGWDDALSPSLVSNLKSWVLDPYEAGDDLCIHTWDWAANQRTEWVTIPRPEVLILEGVGSAHREVRQYADQIIWVEGPADELLDRVLARDGEHIRDEMLKWRIREHEYFERESVKASATRIETT